MAKLTMPQITDAVLRKLAPIIGKAIDRSYGKRVLELERAHAELRKELDQRAYQGVYDPSCTYEKHNSVTCGGCLWIARRDTSDKPGTSDAWQLAVRKGRDAPRRV